MNKTLTILSVAAAGGVAITTYFALQMINQEVQVEEEVVIPKYIPVKDRKHLTGTVNVDFAACGFSFEPLSNAKDDKCKK